MNKTDVINRKVPKLIERVQWLQRYAHLKIVLPTIVAAALLGYVVSLAGNAQAARELVVIGQRIWWIVLVLIFPYLALRLYVWHDLLQQLNVKVRFRRLLLAFAGGEMTKSFPAGVYVENWLLHRLAHQGEKETVRSTATTTAILGLESALALVVVLIVGIPGAPWVRWGLGVVVAGWIAVIAWLWVRIRREREDHDQDRHPGWLRRTLADTERFLRQGGVLVRWRTLADFVPTALYMGVYAVDLGLILQVLGYHLTWYAIITVYASMVLATVLVPIPTEIGIAEVGALGALESFGVPRHRAALVTLALRLLATGATIVVGGIVFLALRGELKEADQEAEHQADQEATHAADGHDASGDQGAHKAASTTEQDRERVPQ